MRIERASGARAWRGGLAAAITGAMGMSDPDPATDPAGPSLPTAPAEVLSRLRGLGIAAETLAHEPVFTVEDNKRLRGLLPGGHCKNLFLRDKKKRSWLVVCDEDRRVDLRDLARRLGAGRFSFGSATRLFETLGVAPGAVTPFALVNDDPPTVTVVLDRAMMAHAVLHYHPLVNTLTTAVSPADLLKFIEHCGHSPHIVDLE
ncbi:MAG: prolyl-tRNA synthetase associated domain-containing protein [Inquilinaceae bacterium]